MDLTGRLSNPDLMALLQRLTAHDWKQAPQPHRSASGPQAGSEVRVKDIQKGVEQILVGSISASSVKDYLRKGSPP